MGVQGCDIHFWRQVFVASATFFVSYSSGLMFSFPAVLNQYILDPNTEDIKATPREATWLAAIIGISGLVGFFIHSPIMQKYGRKICHIELCLFLIVGWILISTASDITNLFVARTIQGVVVGAIYIHSFILAEYAEPKNRGLFSALKRTAGGLGNLTCHSLTLIWDWRQVATFAIFPTLFAIIITIFWPETPQYLAMKGKFPECEKSFRWLRNNSPDNEKELNQMISTQSTRRKEKNIDDKTTTFSTFKRDIQDKGFLKSFLIVSLITIVLDASGKYYMVAYVIKIMTEILGNNSKAIYFTIGADSLVVAALISSTFILKTFKRRSILFVFGFSIVFVMFTIALILILKNKCHMFENYPYLLPILLMLQMFLVSLGIIPVCFTLLGEVIPTEYKGIGSLTSGIVFTFLYALTLKLTPWMMDNMGIEGIFMVYGTSISISLLILYKILPETKDKTLLEIENEMRNITAPFDTELVLVESKLIIA